MGEAAVLSDPEVRESGRASSFEKLQELTRHGYLPDTQPVADGDGILLRHPSAPDLILWADGSVDVPLGQPAKAAAGAAPALAPKERKRRRWGRALLLFSLLVIYTFFSFLLLVALTG